MKKTFLLKTMLLLCALIVGSSSVWAEDYNVTYNFSDLGGMLTGSYENATTYWKIPKSAGNSATISIPITDQPTSNITITFEIATFGSGTNPSSSNTTITAVGTETGSNWSGSAVSAYPSSSTYVNGVMTITKPASPTTLGGLTITMGVNSGVKIFRLKSIKVQYTYVAAETSVATPTFSPSAGAVAYGTDVTINAAEGCTLIYTTDNSNPTESTTATWTSSNTATVKITEATKIRAIAIDEELNESIEASAQYTIAAPNKPNFSPNAGAVALGTKVSLSASVDMILYTIDGTTPSYKDDNGVIYTEPIKITKGTMIKAIAVDDGGNESSVATAIYTINYSDTSSDEFDFEQITNNYGSGVAVTNDGNSYVEEEKTWTSGNVTLVTNGKYRWWKDSSNKGTLRFYNNNPQSTLTLSVPEGYVISKIVFTGGQQFTSNVGTYYSGTGTWFGDEQSVMFTYNSTSSVNVKTITISYNRHVGITPAKPVTTYVTTSTLDFSNIEGLEAFIAIDAADNIVTLAKVTTVPAGTPLLLRGTAGTDYIVDCATSATTLGTNLLRAGDGVTPVGGPNAYDYVLSNGKWYHIGPEASAVSVGKAYLHCESNPISDGAPALSMDWGDETTGIQIIERTINDNQYYTLDGRRVAEPTKGLYIINGKKVVIK